MKQKFHTFTAAPLFTSAEPEPVKVPKYKAGDVIYLSYEGDKYIIAVERFEGPNRIFSKQYQYKFEGMSCYKTHIDKGPIESLFYSDGLDGSKIHPSLESLEGLGPVKVGDTVFLTYHNTQFVLTVKKVSEYLEGSFKTKYADEQNWRSTDYGYFLEKDYKRHASQQEMEQAAKNA